MHSSTQLNTPRYLDKLAAFSLFVLSTLRPDFWKPSANSDLAAIPTKKPNKIAYLDGVRGVASFIVYLSHHAGYAHDRTFALQRAFGWQGDYFFACFPFVRLFFNGGSFAVGLFFIISGYVLSRSALKMLHEKECLRLANYLGVALPRRAVRLYFPVFCTTFVFMTTWHLFGIRGSNAVIPVPEPTYFKEIWRWGADEFAQTFIYHTNIGLNPYNPQLWNIPAQFRASFVVYITLLSMLAFANYPHKARLGAELGVIFYFLFLVNGWYCALPLVGVFLADVDLLVEKEQLPDIFAKLKPLAKHNIIYYVLLIFALYLGGAPRISDPQSIKDNDPGWYYLACTVPGVFYNAKWWFQFWAGTFAMISIPRIPWVKAFFELPPCLYLGKISFGMYLIHGPILWTLGDRLYAAVGRPRTMSEEIIPGWINIFPLPGWGPFSLEINYLVPHIILLPFTMYVAGVINKLFDEPSGDIARWLFDPKRYDSVTLP